MAGALDLWAGNILLPNRYIYPSVYFNGIAPTPKKADVAVGIFAWGTLLLLSLSARRFSDNSAGFSLLQIITCFTSSQVFALCLIVCFVYQCIFSF